MSCLMAPGTEECLLFPTGFAANLGAISALAGGGNAAIFSDELNHASIVDGCRLAVRSSATLQVWSGCGAVGFKASALQPAFA